MIMLLVRAAALAMVPTAVVAQDSTPLPAGWNYRVEQGVDTYVKSSEVLEAMVMAQESPAASTADVEAVTTRIFSGLGCRGTPPPARDGAIAAFGDDRARCFATFTRSPRGHRVAIGLAVPASEAEAVGVARQLTVRTEAAAVPTARDEVAETPVDVPAVNAALSAALDAVPARNLPVHMTLRRGWRYNGTTVMTDYRLWMLFADGFATSCTEWDPATTTPSEASLAPVKEKTACQTQRWRMAGTGKDRGAVFDDEPKDDPTALEDAPPPERGTTFEGSYDSSDVKFAAFGIMQFGTVVMDTSAMSLTRDGEFWFGTQTLNRQSLNSTTRRKTMGGRYMIDKYLMAISVDGRIERHFFYPLGTPEDKELIFYFDGRLLSNR